MFYGMPPENQGTSCFRTDWITPRKTIRPLPAMQRKGGNTSERGGMK